MRVDPLNLEKLSVGGDIPAARPDDQPVLYLCVAGQSGSGKSTILREIASYVASRRRNVVVIDEKAIHHPYLDQLFLLPDRFGLELQLEFMINRAIVVKRWLQAGYSIVMERSHLKDPVFIRHLRAHGHVTKHEHDVYMECWDALAARLPVPSALVFLDVSAQTSIARLSRPDAAAVRPPFGDDAARVRWLTSWHRLYAERIQELRADPAFGPRILRLTSPDDPESLSEFLCRTLEP